MKLPQGFLTSGINCGIKKKKLDLGLICAENFCKAEGFFTTNENCSYSVLACKKNINNPIKAVLVNSGNANCYSHKTGLKDTKAIISKLAKKLKVKEGNILIASTGIIGKKLPRSKIIKGLEMLIEKLNKKSADFSSSILTTDNFRKISFRSLTIGKDKVSISGFAKGAGMIYPNMATMLGFILTDAYVPANAFRKTCNQAIQESFNSINVDGCMSTNDTVLFMSSKRIILKNKKDINIFSQKLKEVCLDLSKKIIKDAEGATKFIEIKIKGAKSNLEAKKAGLALSSSVLFKCALYGANANWGRIISALGQAGVKIPENISIKSTSLSKKEVKISIDLKRGKFSWCVYTSDLTPEYIKINAEYN